MSENQQNGWHLNKGVSVSIIVVLLTQLLGGAWVASEMRGDISRNSRDVARIDNQVEVMRSTASNQAVQLGRIEENVSAMRDDISRLVNTLTREYQ